MSPIRPSVAGGRLPPTGAAPHRRKLILGFVLALVLEAVWTAVSLMPAAGRTDRAVSLSVQRFASSPLDVLSSLITLAGNVEVMALLVLLIATVLVRRGQTPAAIVLGLVFAGGSVVEWIGKHWLPHPGVPGSLRRPSLNLWHHMITTPYGYPSGHAFRTFLLGAAIWMLWSAEGRGRRLARFAVVSAGGLMGLALVYLGDHWASEVIGGYLLAVVGVSVLRMSSLRASSAGAPRSTATSQPAGRAAAS